MRNADQLLIELEQLFNSTESIATHIAEEIDRAMQNNNPALAEDITLSVAKLMDKHAKNMSEI